MDTGEIKVIDKRLFSSGPASSWIEYLVLERLEDGFKLDIRVYDFLGEVDSEEGEDGDLIYPEEIDGKKIVDVDDGFAYGGDLVQATDDTPEITFKTFDEKILDGWLKKIRWYLTAFSNEMQTEEEVLKKIRVHLINHRNQVPKELYIINESDFFELTSNYACLGNWIPNSTFPQYSNEIYKDDIQWFIEDGVISEERGKEIFRTEELTEKEYELFLDKWMEDVAEEPERDEHRGYYICPVRAVEDELTVYAIVIQWEGCGDAVEQVLEGVFYSIDDAKAHLEANGVVIN
jgi:hypothetical protein